jgi:glycine hydroxymethyltransferase
MTLVSALIGRVLDAPGDQQVLTRVRGEVKELCAHFPMYADRQ